VTLRDHADGRTPPTRCVPPTPTARRFPPCSPTATAPTRPRPGPGPFSPVPPIGSVQSEELGLFAERSETRLAELTSEPVLMGRPIAPGDPAVPLRSSCSTEEAWSFLGHRVPSGIARGAAQLHRCVAPGVLGEQARLTLSDPSIAAPNGQPQPLSADSVATRHAFHELMNSSGVICDPPWHSPGGSELGQRNLGAPPRCIQRYQDEVPGLAL
jgi:hypothetical protein